MERRGCSGWMPVGVSLPGVLHVAFVALLPLAERLWPQKEPGVRLPLPSTAPGAAEDVPNPSPPPPLVLNVGVMSV